MKTGTIVLTRFPFTDLSSAKRRPAVVVSRVLPNSRDVVVAFISTVVPQAISDTEFVLKPADPAFPKTGLKKDSVFKMDKLATLDRSIFSGEIGEVSPAVLEELRRRLRIALSL